MKHTHLKLFVVLALVAALVYVACSRQKETVNRFNYHPDVTAIEYYPLFPGNVWTYDVVAYDVDGSEAGRDVLITRVTGKDGHLVTLDTAGKAVRYLVEEQGILKHPSKAPLIRQPILAGAQWPIEAGGVKGTGKIISVDADLKTDAGEFHHCLVVQEDYPEQSLRIRYTYAPRVGLVQMQELLLVDGKSFLNLQATLRIYKIESEGAPRR